MKQALLVSVAAIALAAGSTLALSQGGNPSATPQGGAAAPMTKEARSQIRKSALRWPTRVNHSA